MSKPKILYHESESWIPWKGGRCPEHPETIVQVWLKDITKKVDEPKLYAAGKLEWGKRLDAGERLPGSIIGYRVIEEFEGQ